MSKWLFKRSTRAWLALTLLAGGAGAACGADPAGSGSGSAAAGADATSPDGLTGTDAAAASDGAARRGGDSASRSPDAIAAGTDTSAEDTADGDSPTDALGPADSAVGTDAMGAPDATLPADASVAPDAAADAPSPADSAACLPTTPPTEVCDGVDNDCNGKADDGAACDDSDACTTQICDAKSKACSAPSPVQCDDGNPCTDDACAKATGCSSTAKAGPCDDGDACSTVSNCADGKCAGSEIKNCDDGNACTTDSCQPKTGCASAPCVGEGCGKGKCEDGNPCTAGDLCVAGACMAGGAKCNDQNPCTTDSCNAANGECAAPVPIAGCASCKFAADCNDANDCTVDVCTASVCSHTATAGCIGPTDPYISKLDLLAATVNAPASAAAKLWVTNKGKPIVFSGAGQLKFQVWLSKNGAIDASDVLQGEQAWTNKSIGTPGLLESYMDVAFEYTNLTKVWPGAQFACIRLVGGGDTNPANNDACSPLTVVFPQLQVTSWAAFGTSTGKHLAGVPTQFELTVKNLSANSQSPVADIYLSNDATWSVDDTKLTTTSFGVGAIAAAQSKYTKPQATLPPVPSGPKFACVVVNPATYTLEDNPTDNVMCTPVDLWSPADVSLDLNQIRFRTKAGAIHDNPPYGQEYGCYFTQVPNAGPGPAVNLPARCWLSPGKQPFPGEAGWSLTWKVADSIAAKDAAKAVFSTEVAKVAPTKLGETYVCADLNFDGSVDELTNENYVCRKIAVVGPDLYYHTTYTVFGTTGVVGLKDLQSPPTSVTRGVTVYGQATFCNMGTQVLPKAAVATLSSRILLSADTVPSADDYVIYLGTSVPFSYDVGVQTTPTPDFNPNLGACLPTFAGDTKFTVPLTVTPGNYKVLFEINHTGGVVEPSGNNVVIRSITVK